MIPARHRSDPKRPAWAAAAALVAVVVTWLGVALGAGGALPTLGAGTDLRDGRTVAGAGRHGPSTLVVARADSVSTAAPPHPEPVAVERTSTAAPPRRASEASAFLEPWLPPAARDRPGQPRAPPFLQA